MTLVERKKRIEMWPISSAAAAAAAAAARLGAGLLSLPRPTSTPTKIIKLVVITTPVLVIQRRGGKNNHRAMLETVRDPYVYMLKLQRESEHNTRTRPLKKMGSLVVSKRPV